MSNRNPKLSKFLVAMFGASISGIGLAQNYDINRDRILAESDLVEPPFERAARSWLQCPPDAFRVDKKAVPGEDLESLPMSLESTNVERQGSDVIILTGDAEFIRGSQTVLADRLEYNQAEDTMKGSGNALLIMENTRVTAESFEFNQGVETGKITNAEVHFPDLYNKNPNPNEVNIAARATAKEVEMQSKKTFVLKHAHFTRCGEGDDSVFVQSPSVEINTETEMATARNAVLRFGNVPIFYLPWVRFPITDRRQSGFLFPTFGGSATDGFYTALPYYINIHPQVDATITPFIYTKRGAAVGGELRYMSESSEGGFYGNYIPEDDLENGESRYAYKFLHRTDVGPFYGLVDLSEVSDTQYYDDLESDFTVASSRTVAQNLELGFSNIYGRVGVRTQTHSLVDDDGLIDDETGEIIDDDTTSFTMPYDIVPELFAEGDVDLAALGDGYVRVGFDGTYTSFDVDDATLSTGDRTYMQPYIEYDFDKAWGFLNPKLSFTNIAYSLDQIGTKSEGIDGEGSASGTTLSVGGGLVFEKFLDYAGSAAVMTLEPEMMYANTSADDADIQNTLAQFDTSNTHYTSYDALFDEQRFVGGDRIGDENRLSLGLGSSIYDSQGFERVHVGVGQAFYFSDREVNLDKTVETDDRSPLVVEGSISEEDTWRLAAFLSRDMEEGYFPNRRITFGYSGDNFFDTSFGYYVNENETKVTSESLSAGIRIPLSSRFRLVAAASHDLVDGENTLEGVGIEYEHCCWGLSVDYRNRLIDEDESRERIMVRFRFKGLGEMRSGLSPRF